MALAKECQPAPGATLSDVQKIWDIEVGHSETADMDWRGIRIYIPSRGWLEIHLRIQNELHRQGDVISLDPRDSRVIKSELILCNLGPSDVWIGDGVSLPEPWDEKTYLTVCLDWLQILKKTIDERKKMKVK